MFEPAPAEGAGHAPHPRPDLPIALGGGVAGAPGRRRLARAAAPPRLDPGADAVRRELPRPQGPAPRPVAQHGLRGGPLPQHRGVLGPAHGHDHDPGRHLHPGLRLLRGQDRSADLVRRRRAAPRRRGDRPARPGARGRDERRARRPARRRIAHLRRDHHRDARDVARDGHRGPHPRLRRQRRPAAHGHGRPARHPQPQPRDREATPEAGPQARPLGPLAVRPAPRQGDGRRDRLPGPHQVEPDGRASARRGRSSPKRSRRCAPTTSTS